MAIPDLVYDDCAQLTYTNGDWTAHYKGQPFHLHLGLVVLVYDDRCDDWVNGVVAKFERDKILVQYEDGYRFLFTATRAAIRPKANAYQHQPTPHPEAQTGPTIAPIQDAGSEPDIWRAMLQSHGEVMHEQGRQASRVEALEDRLGPRSWASAEASARVLNDLANAVSELETAFEALVATIKGGLPREDANPKGQRKLTDDEFLKNKHS